MQGQSEHELPVPAADAPQVTRESILGRWTISTGGGSCDIFLALTKWTGGYRAASRGCSGQAALIWAWDVEGNQVILNNSSGNRFASLYPSGEQRFDGATAMGQPVRLYRYARKP
ncbi:protease inhibitor Inh/omp19 family protein [Nitratireductor sp. XY-223]|uniref:protease inhibitor Inh/omp19 family protein n=1 Tax=Nitratireductor sp. XY-223 TaxID=2561926 RepID=UPI0010AB2807|nr:protease inhibitor Inh/omp19 family protein [Nitratireductor sp. XY-223]